ncbi:hypothetical protein E9840_08820 [Tissierella creatinini]|nr:hypothetical protein E9840_08820 [Tissierella creatinini]TJX62247.1 hypothetical protein E8P77_17445 [Soehngenia saccharolytica]
MFNVGDLIIYGNYGVFRVESIGIPDISYINKDKNYYTLSAVHYNNTIYTPVDTDVFMRHIITFEEAQDLIREIPFIEADILENNNIRLLSEHYESSLQTHECSDLIQLIKTVYAKRKIVTGQGKVLGQTDEKFNRIAEDLLHSELSIVLGIKKDEVNQYIEEALNKI